MLIIGDVLAILATIAIVCASTWAVLLVSSALFHQRTQLSSTAISDHPWKCFGFGLGAALLLGFMGFVFSQSPLPLLKVVGLLGLMALFSLATIGGGGMVSVVANRLKMFEPGINELKALSKAAAIIVVAALFPFFGWFLITPLLICLSAGAGLVAVLAREQRLAGAH